KSQSCHGPLLILKLAAPDNSVAPGQFHLFSDHLLGLGYETAKVTPSHISKNRCPPLPVFPIDHDRASLNANVGQLPECNTRTAGSINKPCGDIFYGITIQLRKTHEKPEALGSFNYLSDDLAGQCGFNQFLHVRSVQPVTSNHAPIHLDA